MFSINPIKHIRFASRIAKYGRKIKHRTDLSLLRQGVEVYKLLRLNMLEPHEYYNFELFAPQLTWEEKKKFLSARQYAILESRLNPRKDVGVLNKLVFSVYAKHFGLAIPELYGLFHPHFGFQARGGALRNLDQLKELITTLNVPEFMIKPIGGAEGRGAMLCRKCDDGTIHSVGEGDFSIRALFEKMCNTYHSRTDWVSDAYLVEERVRQHPFFDRYGDSCTQSLRIITHTTASGDIEIISRSIKIARAGRPVDNVAETGIAAVIDRNGLMGRAVQWTSEGLKYFDRHPETGAQITGVTTPGYQDAIGLAIKAQSVIPQLRLIGWDIAITERGPVIFEGNFGWNAVSEQQTNRIGLLTGTLAAELDEIMRVHQNNLKKRPRWSTC